jgi:hypothetical protein
MPQIVTTSSGHRKPKVNPLILIFVFAVVVVAVVLVAYKQKGNESDTPSAISSVTKSPEPTTGDKTGNDTSSDSKAPDVESQDPPTGAKGSADKTEETREIAESPTNTPPPVVNVIWPRKPTGFNGGSVEQILGMMVSAGSASGMPPIPMGSEESMLKDFMVAVTNDIVIFEDDDEYTVKFKEQVADFKNQLLGIVEQGGSITNALKEYEHWINESQAIRRDVTAEYKRLKAEASQEEADAYLAVANKELEAEGIPTVNLGKERKRNRARRDAREAAALKAIEESKQSTQQKGNQP